MAKPARERVIAAARQLLTSPEGARAFTVDAVAERADVARMTVYYQFTSKRGLIDALFDDIAARGLVAPLRAAFDRTDPLDALEGFIDAFCSLWDAERVIVRRLRALALLDPQVEQGVHARDHRRQQGARTIAGRLARAVGPLAVSTGEAADLLHTFTSFEVYDSLAVGPRGPREVSLLIR